MKKHGPFTITDSKEVYKNPWISVREDKIIHPNGKEGFFGIVEMVPGVSILALDEDNNVYLTEGFHYAHGVDSLETVSGAIDAGETPLEAAKRELQEEIGMVAEEWIDLGVVNPFTTVISSPATVFLAKGIRTEAGMKDEGELIITKKIPFDKAVEMVMDSTITHAQSCVLILKAARYLRNE